MKLTLDQNGIICGDEIINQSRDYIHIFSGFAFSSFDKISLVKHKKEIKMMNWKNIGDGMSVFCFLKRKAITSIKFNKIGFLLGFSLFQGFDEETGNKKTFLYKIPDKEVGTLNKVLTCFGLENTLNKTDKGVFVEGETVAWDHGDETLYTDLDFLVSFLFSLSLIYGKLEIKNKELVSVKIHVPLFGIYEHKKDFFEGIVTTLKEKGIFLQKSVVGSNSGLVYQISIQDFEILCCFQELCKKYSYIDIEKVQKYEYKKQIDQILNDYLLTSGPFENKEEFISTLTQGTIKVLSK